MFIPLRGAEAGLRPAASAIAPGDWEVLSRFWYPVAVEGDVEDKPLQGKLLDLDLVIYRVEGGISVALDLCPHRHIRLSAGEIIDDRLVCPFHGLAFNAAGQCTKVPVLGRDAKLPANYRLRSFRSDVRYGLIWVCLDDDSAEVIPTFPRIEEVGIERLHLSKPYDWPVSAPYQVENYVDLAHLPWVHEKTIGGGKYHAPRRPRIEATNHGIDIHSHTEHAGMSGEFGPYEYLNAIYLPFNVYTHGRPEANSGFNLYEYEMLNLAVPISAHISRVFWINVTEAPVSTHKSQEPHQGATNVRREDLEILVSLAKPDYPLDERGQIHLPVDNISSAYRKCLRNLGLGQ